MIPQKNPLFGATPWQTIKDWGERLRKPLAFLQRGARADAPAADTPAVTPIVIHKLTPKQVAEQARQRAIEQAPRQGGGPPGTGDIALPAGNDYGDNSAPGEGRGIIDQGDLRDLNWQLFEDRERLQKERFRAGPLGVVFPQFLPYHGDMEVETPQMRRDYQKMCNDPDVSSSLESIVYGVAAQELQIVPRDRKNKADQKCAEFIRWCLTERIAEQWAQGVVWNIVANMMVQGFCCCYRAYEMEEDPLCEFYGSWPLKALKAGDTEQDLVLQTDSALNVVGVLGLRYNAGVEFSPNEWVIERRCPYKNNPAGTSALRSPYRDWWFLHFVKGLRGMVAQKRAVNPVYAEGVSANEQTNILKALRQLQGESVATVPRDVVIKALELARGSEEHFASFVKDSQEAIRRGIEHGSLSMMTGGNSESRGNSQEQRKGKDLVIWYMSTRVLNALSGHKNGIIPDLVRLNVDRQKLPITGYPKAILGGLDIEELKKKADLRKALLDTGLDLSKEDTYEQFGITPPKDADDVLPGKKEQASNPGMPGMPGAGADAGAAAPPGGAGAGDGATQPDAGSDLDAMLGGAPAATAA